MTSTKSKGFLILIISVLIIASSVVFMLRDAQEQLKSAQSNLEYTHGMLKSAELESQSIKNQLSSLRYALNLTKSTLFETEQNLKASQEKLTKSEAELDQTKLELSVTKSQLASTQSELTTTQETVKELEATNVEWANRFSQLTKNAVLNREIAWVDNFPIKTSSFLWWSRTDYNSWSYTLRVSRTEYMSYAVKEHPRDIDLRTMIKEYITYDDPVIVEIANYLKSHYADEEKLAEHILGFVQALPYEYDIDNYPRYPVETLVEGGGDCEDTSVLYAAIMKAAGFDVVLLDYPGHVMVGVSLSNPPSYGGEWGYTYNGKKYYTAETTGEGSNLGDLAQKYRINAEIHPVL